MSEPSIKELIEMGRAVHELDMAQVDIRREVCKGDLEWRIRARPKAGSFKINLYGKTFLEVFQKYQAAMKHVHHSG